MSHPPAHPAGSFGPAGRGTRWRVSAFFALLLLAAALPDRNHLTTFHETNASVRLYQAQALATRGELHVRSVLCRYGPRHDSLDLSLGPTGLPYPNKAPGTSLLATPVIAALHEDGAVCHQRALRLLSLLFGLIPALVAGAALARVSQARFGARPALVAAFAWLAASGVFTTMGLFQDYTLATSLLVLGALGWIRERGQPPPLRHAAATGAALGLAFCVNYAFAAYGLAVIAAGVWAGRAHGRAWWRPLGALVLAGAPWLVLVMAYHYAAFGHPLTTPYAHLAHERLRAGVESAALSADAAAAWWLAPKEGLLWHAPWAAFGAVGLALAVRRRGQGPERSATLAWAGLAVALVSWSFFTYWHGTNPDDAAFARHAIPALPFLALGLSRCFAALDRPGPRSLLAAALLTTLALGFAHQLAVSWTFPYHLQRVPGPLWSVNWPLFVDGTHLEPLAWVHTVRSRPLPTPHWGWVLVSAAAGLAALALAYRAAPWTPAGSRAAWWARVGAAVALGGGWFLAGFVIGTADPSDERAGRAEQSALDEAAALVLESAVIAEGAGWREEGYATNRWCQAERRDPP